MASRDKKELRAVEQSVVGRFNWNEKLGNKKTDHDGKEEGRKRGREEEREVGRKENERRANRTNSFDLTASSYRNLLNSRPRG